MDYREDLAHLLEHYLREIPIECNKHCPLSLSDHGWIIAPDIYHGSKNSDYNGPDVHVLFDVLTQLGLLVKAGPAASTYVPTPISSEFVRKYKHPKRFWFGNNWLPVSVAAATIVTSLVSTFAYIAYILNWFPEN